MSSPTTKQIALMKRLCEQLGLPYARPDTLRDASEQIDALLSAVRQSKTYRKRERHGQPVDLWTDGGCAPTNPGPGAWAAVIFDGLETVERAGRARDTTNNRMELTAAIEGLALVGGSRFVRVHTDSSYVCHAFTRRWIERWRRRGWHNIANRDLWERLVAQTERHARVEWVKVKGHSGVAGNERVHRLVQQAYRQ